MSNTYKIRDVCSRFSAGKAIGASNIKGEGVYPVYGGNGLRGYTDTYNFDGECAVIGRQGAYCGNVKYFSGKGYMTEHAIVATGTTNNNTRYLAYKFGLMDLGRYAGQSAQPGLSVETLLDIDIDLPDKVIQDRVADTLSKLDAKIVLNDSICDDLESMAKLLYNYWFVQFDFPDENGRPYRSSGGKMVWNEELKREIPEGWCTWSLGEHATSSRGVSYSTPNIASYGVPMLNLASFSPDDTYKTDGLKHFIGKYEKSKVLHPYELIMCNTQQTALDPSKDIIGHCLLVPDIFDGDIISSHHVNHFVFDKQYLEFFVYGESKTTWFHKYMAGLSSGTNILGMDFNGVYKYQMVMPSDDILKKYAIFVRDIESRKSIILKENQQLVSLRDFLLPMLMNGQVRVGEAEVAG